MVRQKRLPVVDGKDPEVEQQRNDKQHAKCAEEQRRPHGTVPLLLESAPSATARDREPARDRCCYPDEYCPEEQQNAGDHKSHHMGGMESSNGRIEDARFS